MGTQRTILITGSTDGLGKRVAEKLASPGIQLLVHGRNAARGNAVVDSIERAGGTAKFLEADFASLAAVRRLARAVQAEHAQLDVLINNAGIAKVRAPRQLSTDGFELHFAVNYLAPFLLTHLLIPQLAASVVNVVSAGQSPIKFADVMLERGYNGIRAYGQSKLAEVMFTFDLAEELQGRNINCLHPGTYIDTAMVRDAGIKPITSVDTAADAVVALANRTGTTGRYFDGTHEARANAQAYDPDARQRLRNITTALLNPNDTPH
jgi:NAD(P)-dependent dehydrogenase (short-subunit alcohol dehydrogenase family)